MTKSSALVLMCLVAFSAVAQTKLGFINVADFVAADGKADVADGIQRLIDANSNRALWFADGTYLLSNPTCTPVDPRRSVDLQLSAYYKTQDLKCKGFQH